MNELSFKIWKKKKAVQLYEKEGMLSWLKGISSVDISY